MDESIKIEQKEKKKLKEKHSDMGFLTLFIIMIPSLIIAMSSTISSTWIRLSIQVVLLLLQFAVVKSFIDDYQKLRE